MRFFCFLFLQFASNTKNRFYTHSLRLTQQPIDAMLQFDANGSAHANLDAGVNGPLSCEYQSIEVNFGESSQTSTTIVSFFSTTMMKHKEFLIFNCQQKLYLPR